MRVHDDYFSDDDRKRMQSGQHTGCTFAIITKEGIRQWKVQNIYAVRATALEQARINEFVVDCTILLNEYSAPTLPKPIMPSESERLAQQMKRVADAMPSVEEANRNIRALQEALKHHKGHTRVFNFMGVKTTVTMDTVDEGIIRRFMTDVERLYNPPMKTDDRKPHHGGVRDDD